MPAILVDKVTMGADEIRESESFYDEEEDESPARFVEAARSGDAGRSDEEIPRTIAELRSYLERVKSGSGSTCTEPAAPRPLKSGMRVRHAQFGEGIVLSRERVGNDIRLVVTFSCGGRKTLLEKFAKLEAI
jgi:hypothetical protein